MVIGVIPRPKILTGQPQSAVSIDWSNPNARGLIGAWTASTPSLLGGNAAPSGTIITTEPTTGGRVWRGTDAATSDNCIRIPRGPMTYTQECTFEVLFRLNTLASSGNIGIMSQYQTVSGVDVYGPTMGFTTGFGISRINFSVRTGASWRTATTGSGAAGIVAGQLVHVVCTASVAAGSILQIYIDGVQRAVASFFAGSFTNDPDNFLSLLSSYVDGGGNNCAGIDMYLARVYNVAKSPTEIQALYKDPWGMFKQTQFLHTDSTASPTSRTFFVPRKKVMSSQPQGPAEIDWGNPITRGLATVYVPTTRFPAQDLITKVLDTSTVRLANSPGKRGAVAYSNTAIGYTWNMTFTPVGIPANYAALSIFALFEQYDTTTGGAIWGAGNNATQQLRFFKNADGTVRITPNTNTSGGDIISPVLSTNTLYSLAAINQGGYREFFIDGSSVGGGVAAINFLNSQYGFAGSPNLFGDPRRIGLYCGYAWTRLLTTPEIKSLSDNPWQIFKQDGLSLRVAEDGKVYAPFMS